jgi:hypothetical protein
MFPTCPGAGCAPAARTTISRWSGATKAIQRPSGENAGALPRTRRRTRSSPTRMITTQPRSTATISVPPGDQDGPVAIPTFLRRPGRAAQTAGANDRQPSLGGPHGVDRGPRRPRTFADPVDPIDRHASVLDERDHRARRFERRVARRAELPVQARPIGVHNPHPRPGKHQRAIVLGPSRPSRRPTQRLSDADPALPASVCTDEHDSAAGSWLNREQPVTAQPQRAWHDKVALACGSSLIGSPEGWLLLVDVTQGNARCWRHPAYRSNRRLHFRAEHAPMTSFNGSPCAPNAGCPHTASRNCLRLTARRGATVRERGLAVEDITTRRPFPAELVVAFSRERQRSAGL